MRIVQAAFSKKKRLLFTQREVFSANAHATRLLFLKKNNIKQAAFGTVS
jgi:hypothetical protein